MIQAEPANPPQRVLLVDDSATNLDIIGSFLRAAGRTVITAQSGAEAVRLAGEQTFDLILMDVRMPDMDGLEAARRVRLLPAPNGQVPIFAVTFYDEQLAECLDAGMNGHIRKLSGYAGFIRAIDAAIGGQDVGGQ